MAYSVDGLIFDDVVGARWLQSVGLALTIVPGMF